MATVYSANILILYLLLLVLVAISVNSKVVSFVYNPILLNVWDVEMVSWL